MEHRRYAVYWAPEAGSALARFGADWLGWDPEREAETAGLELAGLPAPRAELTAAPRRYGLHGTLKPPFRLAAGRSRAELDAAAARFAEGFAAFDLPPLRLAALGAFLALVPERPSRELATLAEAAVIDLDGFRAPADAAELARRRAVGLTPAQETLLARWGYPYVLGEFGFHLTLTGPLPLEWRAAVHAALAPAVAAFTRRPLAFRELCLCGEGPDGRFRILRRHGLRAPEAG